MFNYSYTVFGLNIESELECPEFQEGTGQPEIFIKLGKIPAEIPNPKHQGIRFQSSGDELLLHVDNVAGYYVTNNTITIQPEDNIDMDSVRVFLYGSALAALLIQKNILPLHANALEKDGKGFIIAGDSGAGKSTITTAFHKKGYKILSDDVTVLNIKEDKLNALPGIIYPKLWEDTFEQIGEDKTGLKKIRPQINKYRYTRVDYNFNEAHEIQKMFVLYSDNHKEVRLNQINSHNKLKYLLENVFRKIFIHGEKIKSQQFLHFSKIAGKIDLYAIYRPRELNTINEIVKLIESKL